MSTETEEKLKLKRLQMRQQGYRTFVMRLVKEIDEICEAESYDYERIQVIDQHLQDKLKLLNELNESILLLCDVEEITHEIEESEEINDRILSKRKKIETILKNGDKVHSKINNIETQSTGSSENQPTGSIETQPTGSSENQHVINDVNPSVEGQQQESTATVQLPNTNVEQQHSMNLPSTQVNQQHSNSATKPRLPKITLPRFNGEVTKWNTFWDSFNSAIHTNTDIANIDKFNYLKSLIEGPAARAIQGLTLTNDNYETAIKILEERFGKRQQIVSAHMDELLKIPSCTSDKLDTLRLVYDKISVHTRGLATLGISADQYGSLLIPVIMSKLPSEIRLQIARNTTQDVWKIDELLGIIKKEVEAREASERIKADQHVRQQSSKWQGHKPTAGSFLSKDDQNYTVRCAYCKELHYSASCTKVTDPEKRQDILRNTNRCFNCLRVGHRVFNCQSSKGCRHCKQKHHQSICNTLKSPTPDNKSDRNKTTEESKGTTTTSNVRSKGTVLLQTARTTATNSNGSRSAKVRILFDSGSQRSYISNSLKTRLNLKPVKNETLNLNTFGNSKFRKQNCDLVEFNLEGKDHGKLTIKALSFPVICSSLPTRVNIEDFPHLDGLELADEFEHDRNEAIDVLIGSDYYWQIVIGEMQKGESGPVAVSSKLGWLLSGPLHDSAAPIEIQSNLIISGQSETFNYGTYDEEQNVVDTLKKFWETESIGIHPSEDPVQSEEFSKYVYRQGNRYEVSLPWKSEHLTIPNNYELSRNRLRSTHFKLPKKPELLKEYDQIITEQLSSGVIEEDPEKDIENLEADNSQSQEPQRKDIHYIPHHAVSRNNKNSKQLMKEASFNLRKWNSNSTELLKYIDSEENCLQSTSTSKKLNDGNITQADESYTKTTVGNNSQSTAKSVKVIETSWNTKTDEFQFELDELITFAKFLPLTHTASNSLELPSPTDEEISTASPPAIETTTKGRPRRKAAVIGELLRKGQ